MYVPLLLLALAGDSVRAPGPSIHSGRAGQTVVQPPRLEGEGVVDGILDEPMWRQAAILTGFSQYSPNDGVPAADSTEVLVWYSATALHLGIRAFDATGTVHATLAKRDEIFNDDNVQVFLSTFNDGRQATVFGVNPLGIQADGALNESGAMMTGMQTREQPDLSQDFVWESKGRVTSQGYEVEIRIPFKSIRFQRTKTQTWGINVLRVVQRSGQEQTWTAAKRGASSFLAQSGRLEGLTDLQSGHPLDIVPTVTSSVANTENTPGVTPGYVGGSPQFGGDLRYGITPNLTLHATAHPDFSQIESDVPQFSFDPRQAVSYPEKRPFFLDGIEQFDAPSGLIYTRQIVQPVFAAKLTGKVEGTQVGILAAADDPIASNHGDNPLFGIVRVSRDLGPGSRIGMLWTEEHDGPDENRVLDVDGRVVFDKINSIRFSGAFAHDNTGGVVTDAPLWSLAYQRNGQSFRTNYQLSGISDQFITKSGFINQPGVADALFDNNYTWSWHKGALQSLNADALLQEHWLYEDFVHGGPSQNRYAHFTFNATFKKGWGLGTAFYDEVFGYDPSVTASYRLLEPNGTLAPFTGQQHLPNHDYVIQGNTPTFKRFDLAAFLLVGHNDDDFFEWAPAHIVFANVNMDIRPTDQLRINVAFNEQRVNRPGDGSRVALSAVPVGKVEYQISRALQVRVISQYALFTRDSLWDDTRTNLPIVIYNPATGGYTPTSAIRNGTLQNSFLLSYLPTPGTVVYLGYGSNDLDNDPTRKIGLVNVQESFFVKLSYLWRMRG